MTHSYNIKTIKTANTWRFELHSRKSNKVLLWYSVPHNLHDQGKVTFVSRIADYYRQKKEQKTARSSIDIRAKRLLAKVTRDEALLFASLEQQANSDFLADLIRVNIS